MAETGAERNPIDELAEEFVARFRRGERPALSEYLLRHPELADEIREVIPALVAMEQLKPDPPGESDGPPARGRPERIGDYRILREIGRGGMGVVYEAEQVSLGRQVALKVLPQAGLCGPTYLERFRREARAAGRLHHTNIVPVFGVGESDGAHYYAMQYIHGESLDRVLRDLRVLRRSATPGAATGGTVALSLVTGQFTAGGTAGDDRAAPPGEPSPVTEATSGTLSNGQAEGGYCRAIARLGLQAAEALAYAHRQGIVHRDVKPANLILDLQGAVWITDFGLAKAEGAGELTGTGDVVGTVRYMPPERFEGASLPQGDVYALGVSLYEMLTLRPAFDESNPARLIQKIVTEDPPRPRQIDPTIPRDLETIVLKASAREVSARYHTAEAMAEDLQRFLSDRPIRARRTPPAERLWRWCRRNPAVASLLLTAAVLLLGIAGISTFAAARLNTALQKTTLAERGSRLREMDALIGQARGRRLSGSQGQRFESLQTLREALRMARELDVPEDKIQEIRTEVTASLALPDVRLVKEWNGWPAGSVGLQFDARMRHYARSSAGGKVTVRRVADDAEVLAITGASGFAFSPGGERVVTWDASARRVHLWTVGGKGSRVLADEFACIGLGALFAPDSRCVLLFDVDGSIFHFDLTTNRRRRLYEGPTVTRPRFDPAGKRLAFCLEQNVRILDVETGQVLAVLPHSVPVGGLVWHPDGNKLAVIGSDHHLYLWDVAARKVCWQKRVSRNAGVVAEFTRSGEHLLTNCWGEILRLWHVDSGEPLLRLPNFNGEFYQVVPDGCTALITTAGTKLQVWEIAPGREYRTLTRDPVHPVADYVGGLAIPDGNLLAVSTPRVGVVLWDLERGKEIGSLPIVEVQGSPAFWFDSAGDLMTFTRGLHHWPRVADPASPGRVRLGPPRRLPFDDELWAQSRDGRVLVGPPGRVYFRDRPEKRVQMANWPRRVNMALSSDGRYVAGVAVSESGRSVGVGVWEAETGKQFVVLPSKALGTIGFSPDGRWLIAAGPDGCQLWEVGTWENGPLLKGTAFAFTPDGKMLAVSESPGVMVLRSCDGWREVARLDAPITDRVGSPCFSPDGSRLAYHVGDTFPSIRVWDLRLLRRQLKEFDLDWGWPEFPDAPPLPPLEVQVDAGIFASIALASELVRSAFDAWQKNEHTRALRLLRQAALLDPEHAPAHESLAWCLLTGPVAMRRPAEALRHACRAVELQGEHFAYLNTLGVALYRNGQHARAVPVLERGLALSRGSNDGYDLYFLAMCHSKLSEPAKAKACFDRATQWVQEYKNFSAFQSAELKQFREEAKRVMAEKAP